MTELCANRTAWFRGSWVLTGFLLMLLGLMSSASFATTLLVPENYTFEAALAAAASGDTVSVAANNLDGTLVDITQNITLLSREIGANRLGALTLDNLEQVRVEGFLLGPPTFTASYGMERVSVTATSASFTDCTFENFYPAAGAPIGYDASSRLSFERCTFHDNLSPAGPEGVKFSGDCIAPDSYAEVPTGGLTIRDCVFHDQSDPIEAFVPVTIEGTQFLDCGAPFIRADATLEMYNCLVAHFNQYKLADWLVFECTGVLQCIWAFDTVTIQGNTFVDATIPDAHVLTPCYGALFPPEEIPATIKVFDSGSGVIENNLFIGLPAAAVDAPASVSVSCNDFWEIDGPNTRGGIGDVTKSDDNINAAPLFCARYAGDYTLSTHSPATEENSPCGRMGAYDTACEITPVLVRGFTGTRVDHGVQLRWSLSEAQEVFLRRLDESAFTELYRGQGASGVYVDSSAPAGKLRYGLGIVQNGEEIFPLETLVVAAPEVPARTELLGAFPNPFNPRTEIRFVLERAQAPTLSIYDAAGRLVRRLPTKQYPVGAGSVIWNGQDDGGRAVASGVYFVQMITEGKHLTQRLALIR